MSKATRGSSHTTASYPSAATIARCRSKLPTPSSGVMGVFGGTINALVPAPSREEHSTTRSSDPAPTMARMSAVARRGRSQGRYNGVSSRLQQDSKTAARLRLSPGSGSRIHEAPALMARSPTISSDETTRTRVRSTADRQTDNACENISSTRRRRSLPGSTGARRLLADESFLTGSTTVTSNAVTPRSRERRQESSLAAPARSCLRGNA